MRTLILSTSLLALTSIAAQAQVYGEVQILQNETQLTEGVGGSITGSPTNEEDTYEALRYSGTIGYVYNGMIYGQVTFSDHDTSLGTNVDDSYESSTAIVGRAGYIGEQFSIGLFYGETEVIVNTALEGANDRTFYGIEGGYTFFDSLTLFGQLGAVGEAQSNINSNTGFSDGDFHLLGVSYEIAEGLTATYSRASGSGLMDTDFDTVDAETSILRVDFEIAEIPGLSFFGQIEQSEFFQIEEDEAFTDDTFSLGLAYRFGGPQQMTTMADLGYIETWVGLTGGVLE